MEYDRALFRVYERVMEELVSSQSPSVNTRPIIPRERQREEQPEIEEERNLGEPGQERQQERRASSLIVNSSHTTITSTAAAEAVIPTREEEEENTQEETNEETTIINTNTTSTINYNEYNSVFYFYFPFLSIHESVRHSYNTLRRSLRLCCQIRLFQNSQRPCLRSNNGYQEVSDSNQNQNVIDLNNNSNPLYEYHAERMRIRMNINRQSFLIRNNQSQLQPQLDEHPPEPTEEDMDSQSSSSSVEELERTINDTVEQIRVIRERMSVVRRSNTTTTTTTLMDEIVTDNSSTSSQNSNSHIFCTQKGSWNLFQLCFMLVVWHILVICILHSCYITNSVERRRLNVDSCLEYALKTRMNSGSHFLILNDDKNTSNVTNPEVLLGDDEILQVKILFGGRCTGQCSKVHEIKHNTTNVTNSNKTWHYNPKLTSDLFSTEEFWEDVHYRYSTSEALLYLEHDLYHQYNVSLVNVTLTERCLSSGSDQGNLTTFGKLAEFLSPIYDVDTAIVNLFYFGLTKPNTTLNLAQNKGYLLNVQTSQHWSWRRLEKYDATKENIFLNFLSKVLHKVSAIFISLLSFFLITSITSLVVRVLTSSGVVLMYPLFALFRHFHVPHADERILSLSYPWIGHARSAIRHASFSLSEAHFLMAHSCKIILFYFMYEACQAAWSFILYGRNISQTVPIWIYGMVMIWEYFTMVFVRSATSVYFFPRFILVIYCAFHFYFMASSNTPYPYISLALLPLFLMSVMGMIFTLLICEVPCMMRGTVSLECPREVFTRVAWPDWTASLPQDFTLFLPLNSRHRSLYDVDVLAATTTATQTTPMRNEESNVDDEQINNQQRSLLNEHTQTESQPPSVNANHRQSLRAMPSHNSASSVEQNADHDYFANWDMDDSSNEVNSHPNVNENLQNFLGIV